MADIGLKDNVFDVKSAPSTTDVRADEGTMSLASSRDVSLDTFLKKAGDWAFNTYFLSTLNIAQELAGYRPLQAQDGEVMFYLGVKLPPSNRLPTGYRYTQALSDGLRHLADMMGKAQSSQSQIDLGFVLDAMEVLQMDKELQDYLTGRSLEYYYF